MPAAQTPCEKGLVRFGPFGSPNVETPNYSKRTEELRKDWLRRLKQSTFLTCMYGLLDAEEALGRISKIERDWDSYGAEPPSGEAIKASKEILTELGRDLVLPSTIVPSAGGGVSIYFITDHRTVYVETYNDGSQALVMYDKAGNAEVLEIGADIPRANVGRQIMTYLG